jgi:uncharacterized protein (DUF305 family)
MNKDVLAPGLAGVLIGAVLALLIIPRWGGFMGYGNNSMMGFGGMRAGSQMMGQIDSHFIEQMIPHHEDAITMAKLALTRAEHGEIKTLGNNIIQSQSAEIDQMKKWYALWFGQEVGGTKSAVGHGGGMMMSGGMMGNETDAKTLENAKPFDKEFIKEMIPHHQMAVMMAQMLARSTSRPEMKQLAEDIIAAQTKEINEMREWYNTWYK